MVHPLLGQSSAECDRKGKQAFRACAEGVAVKRIANAADDATTWAYVALAHAPARSRSHEEPVLQ